MSVNPEEVTLVEVGPRDGFQSVADFLPTPDKIAIIEHLHSVGIRRMETTSFVSPSALPQMADAAGCAGPCTDNATCRACDRRRSNPSKRRIVGQRAP